ncbi:MAG: trypsin-like peptidase domain-containing protein [Patescibacteria group bacterium]|nr:trypsin-like peptidase domain-containing protein [Patescibacteria group bacterium]
MRFYSEKIPLRFRKAFHRVLWFFIVVAVAFCGYILYTSSISYQDIKDKITGKNFRDIQAKIENLENQIEILAQGYQEMQERPDETVRREYIKEQSQDELLTSAVADVAPAVVSIVVSKDVPSYEIVYVNPFGDDPFFRGFDIRIPEFRQKGTEEKEVGAGSGFLVSPNGHILTNKHVVDDEDAYYTVLLSDGSQKTAQLLQKDAEYDIAVLKIVGSGYKYVLLGDSDALKLGQSVFAIGNALGEYSNSVSVGIISGLHRNIEASGEILKNVIQTDAAINPGNSGGPLVDLYGNVVGINVATVVGSDNISFAIPINIIKNIIQLII